MGSVRHSANRRAIIVGKGGQARVIASFLPHREIGYLVERDPGPDDVLQTDFFGRQEHPDADYFIAIGDNLIRRRYFDRFKALGITPARCISPTAWIAPNAQLGEGVFVGAGAVIGAGAVVEDNAMVNNLSLLDHESVLGADSQVTLGVILGAELRIGRGCFFGMRSCVVSRLSIGDHAFIMAGAVVVKPVPAGARVGGVPAKIMPFSPPAEQPPPA